jgi:hypothetical protein
LIFSAAASVSETMVVGCSTVATGPIVATGREAIQGGACNTRLTLR